MARSSRAPGYLSPLHMRLMCELFNARHPVGSRVVVFTGFMGENGRTVTVRTPAHILGGHTRHLVRWRLRLRRPEPRPAHSDGGPMKALFPCPHCGLPIHAAAPAHSPVGTPPPSGFTELLAEMKEVLTQMSKTAAALADLQAADTELQTEVQTLLAAVAAFPKQVSDAVSAALTAAGADDEANAAAVEAATNAANTLSAQIQAALAPTAAAQ